MGYPSAGKSSLIAALSRARPKIADYPFTTLVPNLGVVTAGDTTYTVADVPGLIEGASEGKGLGHEFLRHVERCAAIVHVVDMATMEPDRNPVSDLDVIENELSRYGGLDDRPRIVALNKIDVPDGRDMADIVIDEIRARGLRGLPGLGGQPRGPARAVVRDGARSSPAERAARVVEEAPRIVLARAARATPRSSRSARRTTSGWCQGDKPERWVRQTDFANEEAVGFLADRLNRLGVEDRLLALGRGRGRRRGHRLARGRRRGFDFKPMVDAGASVLGSRRGEDNRFEERRPSQQRRRAIEAAYDDRGEGETRADVARREDAAARRPGP